MKALLDLDRLLADGEITPGQHARLQRLAARETATLGYGLIAGFGVVAVALATIALLPSALTALLLGLAVAGGGLVLRLAAGPRWHFLAGLWAVIGGLLAAGGLVLAADGSALAYVGAALLLGGLGVAARSHLLTVLAVLALASALGAESGYFDATYFLGVQAPLATALLFALFALISFVVSRRLPADFAGLALTAARTGVFVVNFALWVGSLFGDEMTLGDAHIVIPPVAFAVAWALVLLGAGLWAWRAGRRWLVNLCAVFGAIHFLTQWFERLGAAPGSVLAAGLLLLGFALALRALNRDGAESA
jgi:iron complex transport system permease protein